MGDCTASARRLATDTSRFYGHGWVPTFGEVELRQISTAMVRAWVAEMADEGLSGARIRQALQVLRASLDVAVSDGLIVKNPASGVKAPRVEKRRQRFLSADELGRLTDAAGDYAPLLWLLGWSGLRWGEAVASESDGSTPSSGARESKKPQPKLEAPSTSARPRPTRRGR